MQNFNRELNPLKKESMENLKFKNVISEIKNSVDEFNSRRED